MSRGITIRVKRTVMIRELGRVMREQTQQFERDKKAYPKKMREVKREVVRTLKGLLAQVRNGISEKDLRELTGRGIVDHRRRLTLLPERPQLNLCSAKQWLTMLEKDTREVIPVNSNSDLWSILKDRCEIVRMSETVYD